MWQLNIKQETEMKKILMILLVLTSFTAIAQRTTNADSVYKPYLNVGTSISNNTLSYGGEVGTANVNSRYAVGLTSATTSPENTWSIFTKGYWKISNRSVVDKVSVYATGALSMALTSRHPLTIEPGLATIFNLKSKFSPQISLGFPIRQNSVFRNRPLGFNAGVSLNYTF